MNEFGQAITNMLYDRMEGRGFLQPLQASPAYAQAKRAYDVAYTALAGPEGLSNGSRAQALLSAADRLRDLEAQYIYRAGIQDGVSMARPGFLVDGLS